ncbi:MAG: ATP-binding cassette domain-containing protein, partial [bacterium]
MNEYAISVEKIFKNFGNVQALRDVSFKVERKQLFGLIGPDGAGKTTLFRILTTLFLPSSGMAFLEGYHTVKDYKMIRKIV